MSLFWDPRSGRPQIWTYGFFVVLTLGLVLAVWMYGDSKAKAREAQSGSQVAQQ